jgi:hypothetical protein
VTPGKVVAPDKVPVKPPARTKAATEKGMKIGKDGVPVMSIKDVGPGVKHEKIDYMKIAPEHKKPKTVKAAPRKGAPANDAPVKSAPKK